MDYDPKRLRSGLADLLVCPAATLDQKLAALFSESVVLDVAHPVNRLEGLSAVRDKYLVPLRAAIGGAQRRDDIFINADNRRGNGEPWLAAVTHIAGTFEAPLWGIPANGRLIFLRVGEFWEVGPDGRIVSGKLIPDLIDLMRQCGRCPLPDTLGSQQIWPGPATHDGVLPAKANGEQTLDLVEGMLGDLTAYDPETFQSAGQTGEGGYWAKDMFWYGPGGIGSTYTYPGFDRDHRIAFLSAFPDRLGGNHYARIGSGNYAAVSGWPSMTMTFQGTYLGQTGNGEKLTLRVMDFYRCAEGQIAENWVLLDYVDLFRQMGRDLIAEGASL
ncbi:hypothetical protein POI8812_01542 [Pontivivens insulae]|uniref:SnoaL-like domain-containing protein n=2 Tax=Pontivivens insulae TaxID=1639689 RepID=A0A2R8AAW6_9RHOB|nr:SnoaL-like polyketide cyclase [Pontivivens insulae]SPF29235.1 hypothetical protein POI8812_01542 [Pontivivens insulae]